MHSIQFENKSYASIQCILIDGINETFIQPIHFYVAINTHKM